jgi:hypothetical protein
MVVLPLSRGPVLDPGACFFDGVGAIGKQPTLFAIPDLIRDPAVFSYPARRSQAPDEIDGDVEVFVEPIG